MGSTYRRGRPLTGGMVPRRTIQQVNTENWERSICRRAPGAPDHHPAAVMKELFRPGSPHEHSARLHERYGLGDLARSPWGIARLNAALAAASEHCRDAAGGREHEVVFVGGCSDSGARHVAMSAEWGQTGAWKVLGIRPVQALDEPGAAHASIAARAAAQSHRPRAHSSVGALEALLHGCNALVDHRKEQVKCVIEE